MATQNRDTTPDGDNTPARRRRAQTANATNTLRPSPAVVRWVHRALSRVTEEAPAPYEVRRMHAATGQPTGVPRAHRVPDHVRARFVQVGRDYHFQSGAPAFRDDGRKLMSHSENVAVVRALVDIAIERGWQDITVSGTARFRHDAWRIASLAGLLVRGYQPSEFEKQKLARELAEPREPSRRPEAQVPHRRAPISARSATPSSTRPAESPERERIYSGKLLKHGPAPYEFHPHGEPSYFMQIQTRHGPATLWGKDLERALHEASASVGEDIRVRQSGRETVTVKRREHDQTGRVESEREVRTHRNRWEIRRAEDFDAQPHAALDGRESRDKHKSDGASLTLKGAQLFANRHIKNLAQRSAFVESVREELVRALERGERIPVPRLRERAKHSEQVPARTPG